MTEQSQSLISTTRYILYGRFEVQARHDARAGLVFAFISMSDIKDEIDWEFTTANSSEGKTNFYGQGVAPQGIQAAEDVYPQGLNVSDWHTYGLNWQADQLQWLVDGNVVRTLKASDAGGKYPRSPSRLQLSTWAGGNSTNGEGTIEWAGGAIDWSTSEYQQNGYYATEVKSFTVTCADQSDANLTTVGSGSSVTSWVYTGQNSSTTSEPEFQLSKDSIPFLKKPAQDGGLNLPGNAQLTSNLPKGGWDGSGDTSGLDDSVRGTGQKSSGSSSSGSSDDGSDTWSFSKNAALRIGVPVAAACVGLIALWAFIVWCVRRRRKNDMGGAHGVVGRGGPGTGIGPDGRYKGPGSTTAANISAAAGALAGRKGSTTRYHALGNEHEEDADLYDAPPQGARRVGMGVGPAPGPTPSTHFNSYKDTSYDGSSTSSVHEAYPMSQRRPGPASSIRSEAASPAMRGPYTPAMNAFTPAMNATPRPQYSAPYSQPNYTASPPPRQQHVQWAAPQQQPPQHQQQFYGQSARGYAPQGGGYNGYGYGAQGGYRDY